MKNIFIHIYKKGNSIMFLILGNAHISLLSVSDFLGYMIHRRKYNTCLHAQEKYLWKEIPPWNLVKEIMILKDLFIIFLIITYLVFIYSATILIVTNLNITYITIIYSATFLILTDKIFLGIQRESLYWMGIYFIYDTGGHIAHQIWNSEPYCCFS